MRTDNPFCLSWHTKRRILPDWFFGTFPVLFEDRPEKSDCEDWGLGKPKVSLRYICGTLLMSAIFRLRSLIYF
jgi:hypothetical protein